MKFRGVVGAILLASVPAMPSFAQTASDTPTVTIINKSAEAPRESVPELTVSPAPETPAVSAPAASATVAAPAVPAAGPTPSAAPLDAANASAATAPADAAPQPAVAIAEPQPEPTLKVEIDLSSQSMTVIEHGEQVHSWVVSTAAYGYRTPTGIFSPTRMHKMWYSRQYDNAPMPHAVFFHQGVAIHATYATRSLGRPASHGCVRLAPKNAEAFYKLVRSHGMDRTQIVVRGRPDHSNQVASNDRYERIRRGSDQRYVTNSYAQRRGYSAYAPAPAYAYGGRQRGYAYQAPRRQQPRGLFNSYSSGYGF